MSAIPSPGTAFDNPSLYGYSGSLLDPAGGLSGVSSSFGQGGFFDQAKSSLAQASPALAVFGVVTGAVGSFFSAQSQKSNLQFQAAMGKINANLAEQSAQSVLRVGQQQVGQITLRAGAIKSAQRVAFAANGIALDSSSAVQQLTSTDLMKEMDVNTVTANAVRSAWGYRTQGVNALNDSMLKSASANSISPVAAGAGSLLAGAGSALSNWYGC